MSIIAGTEQIIHAWLGTPASTSTTDGHTAITDLLRVIEGNWTKQRSTAQKNWMWRQEPNYSDNERQQPEIIIERQIVKHGREQWANQIPTASGLAGPNRDKRRAVDLAFHHGGREFTLFELKLTSDTPWYAATEILLHGLLYLFTREHMRELGYAQRGFKLLDADTIHLRVLAPEPYYSGYDLRALEDALSGSLKHYTAGISSFKLTMDFGFDVFPSDFDWVVHRNASNPRELMRQVQLRHALYSSD